jgi:DNA-directed RNA polymerase subunit RPC12/RpoP
MSLDQLQDREFSDFDQDPEIKLCLEYRCIDCGSYLEFVSDYLVTCPNHNCKMYQIEFDA